MNLIAVQEQMKVKTTIQRMSQTRPTYRCPVASARDTFTACISGVNHAIFRTHGGMDESGKNMPEKKNIGDMTRLK
jgi:hypothetical protein